MYERTWLVRFWKNGFAGTMLVNGAEQDLWAYLNIELDAYSYTGATEKDIEAAKVLKIPTYLAPKVKIVDRQPNPNTKI